MKIKMKKTEKGSPNGLIVNEYTQGETYDVPEILAKVFVDIGSASLVKGGRKKSASLVKGGRKKSASLVKGGRKKSAGPDENKDLTLNPDENKDEDEDQ